MPAGKHHSERREHMQLTSIISEYEFGDASRALAALRVNQCGQQQLRDCDERQQRLEAEFGIGRRREEAEIVPDGRGVQLKHAQPFKLSEACKGK